MKEMTAHLLLLSTCGTSVLTNQASPEIRRWLIDIANKKTLGEEEAQRLSMHVVERQDSIRNADAVTRCHLSAELNGIDATLRRWPSKHVQHLLVHTDTATGRAATEIVKDSLLRQDHKVQLLTTAGLRTDDATSFREALTELTGCIEEWIPTPHKIGWVTIFNLTGGFKSINAYLQALGTLHADRCVFLFEGASALMEIPRLPVKLTDVDEVRKHLTIFRRMAFGYPVTTEIADSIPDTLLLMDDGQVTTSVWGDIVWQRVRKVLLGETLLKPLSPKLDVKPAVLKTFEGLQADKKIQVNDALDMLSAHLDHGRPFPKSNTFKKLEGNPVPPATHELYVWSDGAAGRLYGHFEDKRFVIDRLGYHL